LERKEIRVDGQVVGVVFLTVFVRPILQDKRRTLETHLNLPHRLKLVCLCKSLNVRLFQGIAKVDVVVSVAGPVSNLFNELVERVCRWTNEANAFEMPHRLPLIIQFVNEIDFTGEEMGLRDDHGYDGRLKSERVKIHRCVGFICGLLLVKLTVSSSKRRTFIPETSLIILLR
jgi:hypothetical protein